MILRSNKYIDLLKEVALSITMTNDATGKVTSYRGWTADEEVLEQKPRKDGKLIRFRVDYWDFPQGASEEEMKLHLKENYFNEHDMEEKMDWHFVKAYNAPHKPKPHLAIFRISDRFMDLLSKKQREFADANGIGRLEFFKNPYMLELTGFGSSIFPELKEIKAEETETPTIEID